MSTRATTLLISMLTILVIMVVPLAAEAQSGNSFILIVNSSNAASAIPAKKVGDLFLKKTRTWSDGNPVLPVDQAPDADTRRAFTHMVFDREVGEIRAYWHRMVFTGRLTPPPEAKTDQEIVEFVAARSGAVGYVSSGTTLSSGVRQVKIGK